MPDLTISVTPAMAARIAAAYAQIPRPDGSALPDDATQAEKWDHVKLITISQLKTVVKGVESRQPDPDLDQIV